MSRRVEVEVAAVLRWLQQRGTRRNREGMARYAIVSPNVFGVSVADLRQFARRTGRNHELALALWKTGWHEARMLSAFVDVPAQVTSRQMDCWARDFDNWAICDTICLHLFDRAPHAWKKIDPWSRRRAEFVKRAALALLVGLALDDRTTGDEPFLRALALVERTARDDRNFVKKGASWALRTIGRRSQALNAAALAVAARLIEAPEPSARWVGRAARKELTRSGVTRRPRIGSPRRPTQR